MLEEEDDSDLLLYGGSRRQGRCSLRSLRAAAADRSVAALGINFIEIHGNKWCRLQDLGLVPLSPTVRYSQLLD